MDPDGVLAYCGHWIKLEHAGLKEKTRERERERKGDGAQSRREREHGGATMDSGRSSPAQMNKELRCMIFDSVWTGRKRRPSRVCPCPQRGRRWACAGRAMAGSLRAHRRWTLGDYGASFSKPRTPGERGDQGERVPGLCAAGESSFRGGSRRRYERPVGAHG